jgi:hypothetical protein
MHDIAPHACDAGFQMMCAVPLRLRTDIIGALNLFRGSDELFTDDEVDMTSRGKAAALQRALQRGPRPVASKHQPLHEPVAPVVTVARRIRQRALSGQRHLQRPGPRFGLGEPWLGSR